MTRQGIGLVVVFGLGLVTVGVLSTAHASTLRRPIPVRSCGSDVYGTLNPSWRDYAISVGPLSLVPFERLADAPASQFAGKRGRYPGQKMLVVVEAGRRATLLLPLPERRHAALNYAHQSGSRDNRYALADGTAAVTFKACADHLTQFNGTFIVAGPRCVAIEIRQRASIRGVRRYLPFGTGDEPCP